MCTEMVVVVVGPVEGSNFTISRDLEFPILMFFFPSKQCCFNVYPLDASSFRITQLVVWDLFLVFLAMIDRYLVKYDSFFFFFTGITDVQWIGIHNKRYTIMSKYSISSSFLLLLLLFFWGAGVGGGGETEKVNKAMKAQSLCFNFWVSKKNNFWVRCLDWSNGLWMSLFRFLPCLVVFWSLDEC